jgi:hypothetical protein
MDLTQFAFGATILIGLVNGIQFAVNRDWRAFTLFLTAVISGAVFGYLGWFTIPSVEIGFALGISSSGVYKVAQKLGDSQ